VKKLDKSFFYLLSWGTKQEKKEVEEIHKSLPNSAILPQLDLCELHYLMRQCQYIFAMDSICLHLAATTQATTLSVFGPSKASYYAPKGKHESLQGKCPYNVSFNKRCPKMRSCPTGACMKDITGKELKAHFKGVKVKERVVVKS